MGRPNNIADSADAILDCIAAGQYGQARELLARLPTCASEHGGAFDFLPARLWAIIARLEERERELGDKLEQLSRENRLLRRQGSVHTAGPRFVAQDSVTRDVLAQAAHAAQVGGNLLITGEAGNGKRLLGEHIHYISQRSDRPFVVVNCAGKTAERLEAELFGSANEAGTWPGRFEEAQRGTVLLEAIDALPGTVQSKLMSFIASGLVERVGGKRRLPVDVRIIATTARSLDHLVGRGGFQGDLYHQLGATRLHMPPLRKRTADIPPLLHLALTDIAAQEDFAIPHLSPEAMDLLIAYHWPGNVLELQKEMERAALLTFGGTITLSVLSPVLQQFQRARLTKERKKKGLEEAGPSRLDDLEKAHIQRVLEQAGGNKSEAARLLGITREGLRVKLKRFITP